MYAKELFIRCYDTNGAMLGSSIREDRMCTEFAELLKNFTGIREIK